MKALNQWLGSSCMLMIGLLATACTPGTGAVGSNPCGGGDALTYDGAPATPGDGCGPCAVLACDGAHTLVCKENPACEEQGFFTLLPSDLAATAATLRGTISQLPEATVTDHGFCWSTGAEPSEDSCHSLGAITETGAFTHRVNGLERGRRYQVWAYQVLGEGRTMANEVNFTTLAPGTTFTATQGTHDDRVVVSWQPATGALGYVVVRDQIDIFSAEASDSQYDDEDATPAPGPKAPPVFVATQGDHTDRVVLTWEEAEASTHDHSYRVDVVYADARSLPIQEVWGFRTSSPVQGYVLDIDGQEIDLGMATSYEDETAPVGELAIPAATASEGLFLDRVELGMESEVGFVPHRVNYRLRAYSATGQGNIAGPIEGYRSVGEITYQWERSSGDEDSDFAAIPDADGPTHMDYDAPADRTARYYRVLVGAAPLSPIASASARGFLAEPDVVDPVASADHSTITGVNGLADGLSPADVTIYLADADGSPVVGVVPVFEATGYENSYGLCSATNDEGISTCTLLSTVGEMKTLHLTSPVEVEGNEVTFVQGCNPAGDPFGGGRGTEAHPHTLCGADQLNRINGQGLARHFQLFADIDMANTDFQIIGSQNQFSGVFDGQGYSISNLVIDNAQATPAGFFGYLSGEVFDLSLIDIDILARHSVGGLAGLAFDARIEDVVVQGVVEATEDLVGGLVGSISAGTVERAYLDVEVIGQDIVGGLVGELHSVGQINASTVAGTVAGENTVGGLAGLVRQESSIEDSSSTATVSATGSGAGGFVGTLQGNSILQETSATGDVSGEVDVGGLVGRVLQSYVYSSLATGGVSSTRTTGNSNTGGLIGFVTTGHVEDSYAAGSVDGHFNAGGLIGTLGTINANDTDQAIVNRTYAVGLVTGANTPGGLVGIVFSNVTITSSYWNTETTNQGSSAGGTGRTTEEMGEESNFVGWVFSPAADHVWVMPVGGPPMLWFE